MIIGGTVSDSFWLGLASLLPLAAIGAFFVFAEYSLVVSRPTRIAELAEKGNRAAKTVQTVMKDPDRYFAATQIGITLNSLLIGLLSEPAFSSTLSNALMSLNLPLDTGLVRGVGTAIGLVLASFLQIVLSELVPRNITLSMAERIALIVTPPMNFIAVLLTPFIWLLKKASRLVMRILRLLGLRVSDGRDRLHTAEELRRLLEASEEGGVIHGDDAELIDNALDFSELGVREIMVPRTEMVCIEAGERLENVVRIVSANPYDRYPVYEETPDNIVGILHAKDLMRAAWQHASHLTAAQLMRPEPLAVPDSQRADEVLTQMRTAHAYMAIVLDEFGGTAGVITRDSLLDAIAGDLGESRNDADADIRTGADGSLLISGLTTLGEVNDALDIEIEDDNYDTIGGWVMGQLGRIPKVGDEIKLPSGTLLRVEGMDGKRVDQLRLLR